MRYGMADRVAHELTFGRGNPEAHRGAPNSGRARPLGKASSVRGTGSGAIAQWSRQNGAQSKHISKQHCNVKYAEDRQQSIPVCHESGLPVEAGPQLQTRKLVVMSPLMLSCTKPPCFYIQRCSAYRALQQAGHSENRLPDADSLFQWFRDAAGAHDR
eukprot:1155897-Pelagomonas_calceolata.AAC.1